MMNRSGYYSVLLLIVLLASLTIFLLPVFAVPVQADEANLTSKLVQPLSTNNRGFCLALIKRGPDCRSGLTGVSDCTIYQKFYLEQSCAETIKPADLEKVYGKPAPLQEDLFRRASGSDGFMGSITDGAGELFGNLNYFRQKELKDELLREAERTGDGDGSVLDKVLIALVVGLVIWFIWQIIGKPSSSSSSSSRSGRSSHRLRPATGSKTGFSLIGQSGEYAGGTIPLTTDTIKIGRSSSCHIVLKQNSKGVSREHCIIRWSQSQRCHQIVDAGSSYGTYVNRSKISPKIPKSLAKGDVIYLGSKRNSFRVG